jgi:hypothetical protein
MKESPFGGLPALVFSLNSLFFQPSYSIKKESALLVAW